MTIPNLTAAANLHRLIAEVHADATLTPTERFEACAPLLEAENRALGVGHAPADTLETRLAAMTAERDRERADCIAARRTNDRHCKERDDAHLAIRNALAWLDERSEGYRASDVEYAKSVLRGALPATDVPRPAEATQVPMLHPINDMTREELMAHLGITEEQVIDYVRAIAARRESPSLTNMVGDQVVPVDGFEKQIAAEVAADEASVDASPGQCTDVRSGRRCLLLAGHGTTHDRRPVEERGAQASEDDFGLRLLASVWVDEEYERGEANGVETRLMQLLSQVRREAIEAAVDWPTILRARARELRERANAMPGTEGGTHALKIAEELGRLCNTYAPKAKHASTLSVCAAPAEAHTCGGRRESTSEDDCPACIRRNAEQRARWAREDAAKR